MTGTAEDQNFGSIIGSVPDVDADGDDELLVMDPSVGDMYFFLGGQDLEIGEFSPSDADAVIDGVGATPTSIVNIGDWTADGRDDVGIAYGGSATGASGGTVVILESASWTGTVRLSDIATGTLKGSDYNQNFGRGIAKTPYDLDVMRWTLWLVTLVMMKMKMALKALFYSIPISKRTRASSS